MNKNDIFVTRDFGYIEMKGAILYHKGTKFKRRDVDGYLEKYEK